jgi:hypothetical protein
VSSFFKVGKYEVHAWAKGSAASAVRRMKGLWSVFDPASESKEPIAEGKCDIDRESDGEAINDAITAGSKAADALRKKDGG